MADRDLTNHDAELAGKVKLLAGLEARLAKIDASAGTDEYHVLKGLKDPTVKGEAKCCYLYQRAGGTGTRGNIEVTGPLEQPKIAQAFAKAFEEKTGAKWGSIQPGDRAKPGKYWLQHQADPDLKAKWQYYVSDGVDGKKTDWYPYTSEASDEVEEIYSQHIANARDTRTSTRIVRSGYFSYQINLDKMTQTNMRTRKVRTIRRAEGAELREGPLRKGSSGALKATRGTGALKAMRAGGALKAMRAMTAMKVMKKAMKKTMKTKKAMKKKAMKKKKMTEKQKALARKARSKIGTKKEVMAGKKEKTKLGLKKADLLKSKSANKIVSKRKSASCKRLFEKNISQWVAACQKARQELGLTGFVAVKKGTPFYEKVKELLPSVKPFLLRKGSSKVLSEPAPALVKQGSSKELLRKGSSKSGL